MMNPLRYLFVFLVLLAMTIAGDAILDNWHYREGDHRRLQSEIDRKFKQVERNYLRLLENDFRLDTQLPHRNGILMFAYRKDSLIYWSDNSISIKLFNEDALNGKRFDFISNGWYVIMPFVNDTIRAYGLLLIQTRYPYENEFLISEFQPDLKLPSSTELFTEPEEGAYSIHDWEGIYLFSIKYSVDELRFTNVEKYMAPLMYFICLIFFLFFIDRLFKRMRNAQLRNISFFILVFVFAAFRWFQYAYHVPFDVYDLELFGPVPFGKSTWLPSLGDVFLNTLLILFLVIIFNRDFQFPRGVYKEDSSWNAFAISVMIFLLSGFYIYTHFILSNLILHSTINFETYKIAGLNTYTLIGLIIAAMHFTCLLLISNKLLTLCKTACKPGKLVLAFVVINVVFLSVLLLIRYRMDAGSLLAFLAMFTILALMKYRNVPLSGYATLAFMVLFFSVYLVYFISHYTRQKNMNNMRVLAENLAVQHDPVAEYLLEDISRRLEKDETLAGYLFNRNISVEEIFSHLQRYYFNGFWGKYKLLFQDCTPYQIIQVAEVPKRYHNCYDFYDLMLESGNIQIPNSKFYFLDVQNGRINYLGRITYTKPGRGTVTLFLELRSRLVSEETGYPELLLDSKYQENRLLEDYSYAKYYRNQLLTRSGSFQYSLNLDTYKNSPRRFGGYDHFIYYLNEDNVIMVSKPTTSLFDKLVSLSYVFLFYYLLLLIFNLIRNISKLGKDIQFNFKNKIQLSILSVLLLSLILVGGGTVYFSLEQYQKKQHDILSEKIQSVYIELDQLLAYQNRSRLTPNWSDAVYDNLNQLLVNLSDIFYSDINLYDPDGNLLATSRSEIFKQGILGEKMNPVAYEQMVVEKQAELIHQEHIGRLSYHSAYVPFVNAQNKLLAFLNLPYFTKQSILRNDITTLVVAVVNIYVLLILLTIAMAVLISDQITRPLKLIQQKFSEIKIGKKNEEITYHGRDEIAGLVDEYNRMVKELVKSVEMLAKSERESAWREMAKQIAHEIKNPLTPMKLSVQHLQRSWENNRTNFEDSLEKVTRTLIEQIDNLSFIASEFSNFAKMPKAYNEEIELVGIIRSALALFANTENTDLVLEHEPDHVVVFADREQLLRVFINLIKNSIQSIPDDRRGRVIIQIQREDRLVHVKIADNGKGIPEDLQSKLFTPSFTTKSSGMGLGLSIAKNIIVSFNGNITFKTKVNSGTTFTIELPCIENGSEDYSSGSELNRNTR
jgi:signal transduction histidine kinase